MTTTRPSADHPASGERRLRRVTLQAVVQWHGLKNRRHLEGLQSANSGHSLDVQ